MTGIEQRYLEPKQLPNGHGYVNISLSLASVAERMSWVASRTTTRDEDLAYCLFFGDFWGQHAAFVSNCPPVGVSKCLNFNDSNNLTMNESVRYGEGRKAFIRLQLEIIRKSDDETIFAW